MLKCEWHIVCCSIDSTSKSVSDIVFHLKMARRGRNMLWIDWNKVTRVWVAIAGISGKCVKFMDLMTEIISYNLTFPSVSRIWKWKEGAQVPIIKKIHQILNKMSAVLYCFHGKRISNNIQPRKPILIPHNTRLRVWRSSVWLISATFWSDLQHPSSRMYHIPNYTSHSRKT
jgi:hypothetical protein